MQFKTYLTNGTIRRCEVKESVSLQHWKRIVLNKYFNGNDIELIFSYMDEENEWIHVLEEDEWRIAMNMARLTNFLKIRVETPNEKHKLVIDSVPSAPTMENRSASPFSQPPQTITQNIPAPMAIRTPIHKILSQDQQQNNLPSFLMPKRPISPPKPSIPVQGIPPSSPFTRLDEKSAFVQPRTVSAVTQVLEANTNEYKDQMNTLLEMGYKDEDLNQQLLEKHKGELMPVITVLLERK
jgi:hypothetical protein